MQLLEGSENISKSDTSPANWAAAAFPTDAALQAYLDRNTIPHLPDGATEFAGFWAARRSALAQLIARALDAPGGDAVERQDSASFGLQESVDDGLGADLSDE